MTLKKKLSQYIDTKEEIKRLEQKLEKLEKTESEASDSVTGSSKYFPYVETHFKIEGTDIERAHRLDKLQAILKERYDSLLKHQIEVEEFIDKIPTSRLRRIFEYRYLDNLSWMKIAQAMGGKSTDESIKKEHQRYLNKK